MQKHFVAFTPPTTEIIVKQLSLLRQLRQPLLLAALGMGLLGVGTALLAWVLLRTTALSQALYALQLPDRWVGGVVLALAGLAILAVGLWRLSSSVALARNDLAADADEFVLDFQPDAAQPKLVVLSGGAGILILASLGQAAERLTCVTPVQDPIEYYYHASSLYHFENVIFVPPTHEQLQVDVELDDGTHRNIKDNISHDEALAHRYVVNIDLSGSATRDEATTTMWPLFQQTLAEIEQADAIILGPGSLFESILPNLLIPELRAAIQRSKARKIYICNLMTEPGMTSGFGVAEHIRQIVRYGGFVPDYVLVNAQWIDPDVRRIYQAAHQMPVYLNPEEYEETIVSTTAHITAYDLIVEGAVIVQGDLVSSMVQLTASLDRPNEARTIRVLRHDPEKLAAAIKEILRRE